MKVLQKNSQKMIIKIKILIKKLKQIIDQDKYIKNEL